MKQKSTDAIFNKIEKEYNLSSIYECHEEERGLSICSQDGIEPFDKELVPLREKFYALHYPKDASDAILSASKRF